MMQGNVKQTVFGVAKGVKGLVSNSTVGVANSVSRLSGSWYIGIRGIGGREMSESNLDNPNSIPQGLYKGTKGFATEVGKGVIGVVTVPVKRVRREGTGCSTVTKGVLQGCFGVLVCPFTAVLKLVHSTSSGIKNFASGKGGQNRRMRFPRYMDEREVMEPYDPVKSHAFSALQTCESGEYCNEQVLLAKDVSFIKKGAFKERVLIVTDQRLLLV